MSSGNMGMADLRKQAQVLSIRRNDNGHGSPDPIQEALQVRKQLVGNKLMEQAVNEADTEAIKAQNERLKAEIEAEQLREQKESRTAGDKYVEYIMGEMKELREQLSETQRALNEQQTQAIAERYTLLKSEIERLQQQPREQTNPYVAAAQTIQEARNLINAIAPTSELPPPVPATDPAIDAWMVKANHEQERWRVTNELAHRERLSEIEGKLNIERERLEIERAHYEKVDRFISDTAPKVVEIFAPIIHKIVLNTPAPPAAFAAMPQATPQATPQVPVMRCQQCPGTTFYASQQGGLICTQCGTEYQIGAEAPPAPAEPVQPPIEADEVAEGVNFKPLEIR